VRHKVLDLIGDLALAGHRLEGHVVAVRAGHAMHTAFVARLLKDRSAWELAHVPVTRQRPRSRAGMKMAEWVKRRWRGRRGSASTARDVASPPPMQSAAMPRRRRISGARRAA
jgi:hypothetical protein